MPKSVELHEEALAEADAAAEWYAEREPAVANAFAPELERAFDRIGEAPERWPIEEGRTRRVLLRRFPFKIIYLVEPDRCVVVAVAHWRRRPGYWKPRS